MIRRIRLDLLQNGLHSTYHGIEHLATAVGSAEARDAHAYDPDDRSVEVSRGKWYVSGAYQKVPAAYGIKFALLHLIQGVELILKAYLEADAPGSTIDGSGRSISMRSAARELLRRSPAVLNPAHLELILRAGEVRNEFEHSKVDADWTATYRLAVEFLSVANYLAFALHGLRLAEEFDFDPYREDGDPVSEQLGSLLGERSEISREMVMRLAAEWSAKRPDEKLLLCLQCGARGLAVGDQRCGACGAVGDLDIAVLIDELDAVARQLRDARADRAV